MGSNCCKGDAARPIRSTSSIYSRSRAGASLDDRFTSSEDAGGVRLTVSAAQTGDSGVYTLQASNAAGSDTSKIRLEVSAEEAPVGDDPPAFLRRLQDLTVKVGSRTRFLVEIISSTECKVTWYRNERRLLEAERVALARDGNFWCADVAAVSVDDAGRWTCTAENAGGRASCSAHLNVLVPKAYKRPEFVEELRALLTEQGTVSLECKVVGVPTPVLRWFKDSREIKAGDVFALTANAEDPTSLGTYTCEAVNCMGRAYSSSKVHVVGRASREGSARPSSSSMTPEPPPIFTKELEDAHVKICEHLTLGCHIVVPPWPRSVVWYNKEGKVEPGERYHAQEDGVGGYLLEIPSTEWVDEGEWKCVATSAGGRVGISTCYVAMDVPKNYRKPRFMENLQAVLTEEGLVSFECKVVGFPTPVLSWFKDGQELKPGDVYQLTGTNSLGSYCCIARNCMGKASSSAELTVEDIQNQLNEEEKLQLFSKNQAPKFNQGLKSVEAKIDEPFRFTVKVAIPPEPSVLWYRDDQPVDESNRCHLEKEAKGIFNLDIQNLEFLDQAEWKCVAMNDFGHSVTSCFLKLIIPRHYKKPRFLENLQAILSDEGAVNLECKVIGVPQPILKWYKDGEELKPGDIHRIISGQDGTCCLGTYTCEAQNCMGIAASSASLLGFDDSIKAKAKKTEEQALQRNLSLSTIHEERTSQMYDTPVGDITLDDKGEISFSFDGKEVSVSLYETPDLTEEEALQIVEMYADQLSENVTEHNVVELPPLRFVKETSTSGNLLMEAIIIDVSPEYFPAPDERTEADVEDLSIADENGPPQLSLDQDIEDGGEDYLQKTMALLSDEKSDFAAKSSRKKSDSQRSIDDFYSLSRDQSLSEEKRDDDTHVSESELQSFASARSSAKVKSKSSKPSDDPSEPTKTVLMKEEAELKSKKELSKQQEPEVLTIKHKRERRTSRGSRRSSTSSEKSIGKSREELLRLKTDQEQLPKRPLMDSEEFRRTMGAISTFVSKVINDVQFIERDIILKSELMASAATASRSLEIISSLITPLSEINSIADAAKESIIESREVASTIFNSIPQPLKALQQSLTIIEKCIDMESDNKTLVKKTCVAFIETCGTEIQRVISNITSITSKDYLISETKVINEIDSIANEMTTLIKFSTETIKARNLLCEASEIKQEEPTLEVIHLRDTQKAVFELKSPLNSLLRIVENAEKEEITDLLQTKNSAVIMHNMSTSIQDLQTALEQIESLSVKETSSNLQKHNTEIIETVMESVLKLRSSFEFLSTEPKIEEEKAMLKQTLKALKENLTDISLNIKTVDEKVGQFNVLQSENKLEILQKMAQILIALENNLPRLEYMPEVKSNLDTFHKNLTKVLENVIESNDAKKYITMMEICDTVNIMNSSIKNLDSENILPLASLSNTLKIIRNNFIENVFESELNCSLLDNISDILVGIEKAINKAEEVILQYESENIKEMSIPVIDQAKVNVILEQINQTIAAVNTIKIDESIHELKTALAPTLENICPILEEIRRCVASVRTNGVQQDEHLSEISDTSLAQNIAIPLCELNQNIIILNQIIVENIDEIKDKSEIITAIAEPLHELHSTLEIIQHDVISQYGDDLTPYEVSINMASVVQNLQSCIVMIYEQAGVEGADDMSTLEDISGIKTTADTIPSDRLVLPTAEETTIEQSLPPFLAQEMATTATAHTLQTLNEHITVLQSPEVIEALDTLSEVSDYSSLKSVVVGLGDLHAALEGILHPVPIEASIYFEDLANITKLAAIAEPMQDIQQSLSVLDTRNIPIYENILDLPTEKVHSVFQSISEFKNSLEQCMNAVLPAMEITNNTIEISNKVSTLRDVCEQLKDIFETSKDAPTGTGLSSEIYALENVVDSLIDATDVSKEIRIDKVKTITEKLYSEIMKAQEDIIQFTAQTPDKLSQEAKFIRIVSEVQNNIAALEQYDFIDLSQASDITTACISPQIAIEINSEALTHVNDIAENAVDVLHDSYQEIPLADLIIVEDFIKTCKNEFTILRCLISKATSHKKIIRLLQEFNSLQVVINNFTSKRFDLNLSDEVNECLTTYLIHADECLKNARLTLIKVINTQSDMLIKTPITQMESIHEVKHLIKIEKIAPIGTVVKILLESADLSKSLTDNLQKSIINELSQPAKELDPCQRENAVAEKLDELATVVDAQFASSLQDLEVSSKTIFDNLITCINRHQDYKDAVGTGKTLIAIKCLAECVNIVKNEFTETRISTDETAEAKEHILKEVLTEMLQPLQALQVQLVNIQEQVLAGAEEDSISIDITTTESIMQTMTQLHKDIVQQIESDRVTIDIEDIDLIKEVNKEIHTIQDSILSIDNVQAAQTTKEITKLIDEIEMSLNNMLSTDKDTVEKTISNETTSQLLDTIDQYIELIEVVEEISAVIKIEDVNESFDIARELKQIITASENITTNAEIEEEQFRLAQKLQTALSALQVQVLDSAQELAPVLSADVLQRIAQITAQLQANLVAVTGLHVAVQAPVPFIEVPTHVESAIAVSSSTSEPIEVTKIEEIVQAVQEPAAEEHVEMGTEQDVAVIATKESAKSGAKTSLTKEVETISSHILETPQISDEKIEEVFMSSQENLMQHIDEYVSEDIIETVKQLSSILNSEQLNQSTKIAKELRENVAAIDVCSTEDATGSDIEKMQEHQSKLIQCLQSSLSCLSETTLEHLQELAPSMDGEKIEKVVFITENLNNDLGSIQVSQQEVLQAALQEPQEIRNEFETVHAVKGSIGETTDPSSALVEPLSIPTAVVEIIESKKEGEVVIEEIPENIKVSLGLAVESPSISIEEEVMAVKQPKTLEADAQTSEHASLTETLDQLEFIEETENNLITYDEDALQADVVKSSVAASPDTAEIKASMESTIPVVTTGSITPEHSKDKAIPAAFSTEMVSISESSIDAIVISDEKKTVELAVATVSQSNETDLSETEIMVKDLTETTQAVEKSTEDFSIRTAECNNLMQHIDVFISDEVTDIVNKIANITSTETLTESIAMAKLLRETVVRSDYSATFEETSLITEKDKLEQAKLAQKLQDALTVLHTQVFDSAQIIAPIISSDALQKVSEIITHLQDDLATAIVFQDESIASLKEFDVFDKTDDQNSMVQLETLLKDVNIKINITSTEKTTDTDNFESLKDSLDEVQTVIIKLKREYDDAPNDTFNEILEDLECSVRSVQLQINEESPPELLSQACATLQLLVDNMNATQQVQTSSTTTRSEKTENMIEKCSSGTDETVILLDIASKLDTKGSSNLSSVVNNLNIIRDSLKSLRDKFLVDADTVIENGVELVQCLDQIEELIFSLDKDIDTLTNVAIGTKDSILTAVHSVYGSISNMRSTVSSVQKQYMFDHYGKPSESLLHSIKNITVLLTNADNENKLGLKKLSKSLRRVLNHFEDIKFYINLDKTARLPNDAAFTKIILEELKDNISNILVARGVQTNPDMLQRVNSSLKCVEKNLMKFELESSIEVKNKIPMFKEIAAEMLKTTTYLKKYLEQSKKTQVIKETVMITVDSHIPENAKEIIQLITTTGLDKDNQADEKKNEENLLSTIEQIHYQIEESLPSTSKQTQKINLDESAEINNTDNLNKADMGKETNENTKTQTEMSTKTEYDFTQNKDQIAKKENEKNDQNDETDIKHKLEKETDKEDIAQKQAAVDTVGILQHEEGLQLQKEIDTKEKQQYQDDELQQTEVEKFEKAKYAEREEEREVIVEAELKVEEELAPIEGSELKLLEELGLQNENEKTDLQQKDDEEQLLQKDKVDTEHLQNENELRFNTKKEAAELIQEQEEEIHLQKEMETVETKQKDEYELCLTKESKSSELKHKQDQELCLQEEQEEAKRFQIQQEEFLDKQAEDLIRVKKTEQSEQRKEQEKKEDVELKQNEEELLQKKMQEMQESDEFPKQYEEIRLPEEVRDEVELKDKQDEKGEIQMQKESQETKFNEKLDEEKQLQIEKEMAKQKEKERHLQDDNEMTDIKEKEAEERRLQKQKEDAEKRLQKEKEAVELKEKQDKEIRIQKETEISEHKQKKEEEHRLHELNVSKVNEAAELNEKKDEEEVVCLQRETEADEFHKQQDEEVRLQIEEEIAERNQKEEWQLQKAIEAAEIKESQEEEIQKEIELAELKKKEEEEYHLQQEKEAAELRKKPDQEILILKEKELAEQEQQKEEEEQRLQKEKEATELKENQEKKLRMEKEKELAELKQKEEEERQLQKQKEATELKKKQDQEMQIRKEKETAELKHKEEEEQRLISEKEAAELKENQDKKLRMEKEKELAELKKDEEERQLQQQQEATEMKKKQDQEIRIRNEKELAEQEQQKEEEEQRLQIEKETAELKQKEEEEQRLQREKEATELKENQDKKLLMAKEKELAELKQKEEEERQLQQEKVATELKKKQDQEIRIRKEKELAEQEQQKEEEKQRLQKEKETAELKQKEEEEQRLQREKEATELKENQDKKLLMAKEKELAELKQKEEEERHLQQEKVATELKKKQDQEIRIRKEKELAEQEQQKEEEEQRLQIEKETAELKQKEEEEQRLQREKEATELKENQEKKLLMAKEKELAELKQKEEEERQLQQGKVATELKKKQYQEIRIRKEKELAEQEQQKEEEEQRLQIEKESAKLKKKQDEEILLLKEKETAELKQKEEEEQRLQREKEATELKENQDKKLRMEKYNELADLKQNNEQERHLQKEKEAVELKNKQDEEVRILNEKEIVEIKQKEEEEQRLQSEKEAVELKERQDKKLRKKKEKELAEQKLKKEQDEEIRIRKEKEIAELKQKEVEQRLQSETEAAKFKETQDKEIQMKKEIEVTELKQKEEELLLKKQKETELQQKQDEEVRLHKEEEMVKLKQKETDEWRLQKEKEVAVLKEKQNEDIQIQKGIEMVELKLKDEEKQRFQIEKETADLKDNQDKEKQMKKEIEFTELQEKEAKEQKKKQDEEVRIRKEKETAELKQKEEEEQRMQSEKENQDKKRQMEKETESSELKQKEEEERHLRKEKEAAELKKKQEEEIRIRKEKELTEQKQKEEEEQRLKKEKEVAERKEKQDEEIRLKNEIKMVELKQKEEEVIRLQIEKEAAELKVIQDQERRLQKEKEAAELKEREDKEILKQKQKEMSELKSKDEEKLQKEKEASELKEKQDKEILVQEVIEMAKLKQKEEKELHLQKEKEATDIKLKQEDELPLQKENDNVELIQKGKDKLRLQNEKESVDSKLKQEEELRLQHEKEATELKQKKSVELRLKEEKTAEFEKEKQQEKVRLKHVKEAAELKEKLEKELILQKKRESDEIKHRRKEELQLKTEKAEAELKQKEEDELRPHIQIEALELKQNQEEEFRLLKQKDEPNLNKEKYTAELKQIEEVNLCLQREKELNEFKQKQEKELHSQNDKEVANIQQKEELHLHIQEEEEFTQKQKEETRLKKENKDLERKQKEKHESNIWKYNEEIERDKDESEIKVKQENKICLKNEKEELASDNKAEKAQNVKRDDEKKQKESKLQLKVEEELRLTKENKIKHDSKKIKIEKETFAQQINDDDVNLNKDNKLAIEVNTPDNIEIVPCDVKMYTKTHKVDEIPKKSSKYTERLDKNERRDDELHIFKNNSQENSDFGHKYKREASHEQHYIKEYQYEASQTSRKVESREKPRFVDHNHRDYTMEFARPSGNCDRYFDTDKTESHVYEHLGRNATIFKAQTLVLDAQLRSSAPPYPEISISRTPQPIERSSEIRHERRTKARSEARSIISEKRTALTRDSKRKPVFSTYLTDRTAVEGSRVKLTCSVLSSSDPTVTWYKNGVIIDNKLKYRTKIIDGLVTLEVLNAIPSDSAEYSCTISNENGSVNTAANLKVYPSFEASPIPPTFTRSIRDTYHMAENELILECRIRGQPLPTITWLKGDKPVSGYSRYQAYYLADGVCRLAIEHPTLEDSGKYTCKAENSVWSDEITHVVNFTGKENRVSPNIATLEKSRFNRQAMESRRPHFTNVLSDYKVIQGGTIGLQVEIRGAPTRVEWLREGCSVTEVYRNAKTFVEQGLYTLALSDVTKKESGMYTCRAWSSQSHVDMNAAITVVEPNELEGKPAVIVGRPEKDILISVGEDVNISFRVQGEPKPKVVFMKGIRDITTSQRVCKMTSDDYVKFTLKRSIISDAGTYCILARNAYGCDRAFVTVVIRQRASSDNLISDWTYPTDDTGVNVADRKYKSVPERIPGVPAVVEGGNNWLSLAWPKSEPGPSAPVLAYKVESWLLGKEGGARWTELGITPLTSFDAFNLKQGEEYHFRVTPRNRYGWGESVQTPSPISIGSAGDRPEFSESLPGQLKVLIGTTANLSCCVKGKPVPEVVWMKNGHEIEDEDRRLSNSFNGFNCCLTIKDINIEDEARYSCEAANVHGRASTYARLAVVTDRSIWEADAKLKRERSADAAGDFPPQFTMRLRDRRVQATYPVRLTCQVIGGPHPAVTWFKDGEPVKLDLRRNHFQDEHFHTLEIAPTTLEDGGVYEVMARNSSGAVSCHCSLVVDKGIRAYVAPEFCCGLEPLYKLRDGEELRITAVVEAYPSVGVTWYRDGVRLRPSRRTIMTLDRDGQIELALAAVTSRDAGVYTCTASNEVGRASTSGKVDVMGPNVVRTPPVFIAPDEPYSKEPLFIRKPRSSEAREGDTVIIACEVVGDPKPDVYWLRDFLKPDYYRDATHFKRIGDGPEYRFEIPHAKLDYTGAYSVVAKNQYGEAKAIISLQILAKDPSATDDVHNISYGRVEVLPRFSKDLTDLLSCDGDVVEFECRLSGNPEPTIKWFHYHELIRDSEDFESSFEDGAARLKIKQVTAEDEGTYTCEAANNLGKATSSACLVVYPPGEPNTLSQRLRRPPAFLSAASTPRSTPRSTPARSVSRTPGPEPRRLCSPARTVGPAFYTYPFNKVAEEGETVTLQCAIKGNPAPWATWDKDGVILTPSARVTIKEKEELRMIEIEEISAEDVGVYRITIENEFGRQEATARIEVITQRGKFYAGVRAVSPSPRKSLTYRSRRPSTPRQD